MWNQRPSFRFEIDNFSEKEADIVSQIFVSGGCEWFLCVYPKGYGRCDDHLSLYIAAANHEPLRTGWKRSASFYFVVLNQSDKELYRSPIGQETAFFSAKSRVWGIPKTLPLSKFHEKGFLENDKLIIEVYIKIIEADDGEGGDVTEKKETVDINGFQAFASQVTSVKKIFAEHKVKTEYKNVLSNACSKLSELAEAGIKLDWLKSKLDEVSLKRKKADDDADGSRVQQLEERVTNLELMEPGFKMDCLKSKLDEILLKRKKENADGSHVHKLEERVNNLELMQLDFKMNRLNGKLEDVSEEIKLSYEADSYRVKKLEKSVKNLELMVSDLKVELDKEKAKSSAHEFLLVDEDGLGIFT